MMLIDLYTDISCPWCLIGQHRLDAVLAAQFPDLAVEIHHHPVLLMPDAPADGVEIADMLRARYGITDPRTAFARPEAEARASGLALDLGLQPRAYRTQPGHALVRAARERGTEHALAGAIVRAYFLEARNTGDADVLAEIARAHGFGRAEARDIAADPARQRQVEEEAARAAARGIRSVPHFIFNRGVAVSGGQREEAIAAAIRQAAGRGVPAQ